MAISAGYLERLATWVKAEKDRTGLSDAGLARAITDTAVREGRQIEITYGAIQHWRHRRLKKGLTKESIQAIAAYKGESAEKVEAWLENRPIRDVPPPSLQEQIDGLRARIEAIEATIAPKSSKSASREDRFAALIRKWEATSEQGDRDFQLDFFGLTMADLEAYKTGRSVSLEDLEGLLVILGQEAAGLVSIDFSSMKKEKDARLAIARSFNLIVDPD